MATAPPPPDDAIAAFVAETTIDDLPDAAVRTAERAFVDTVGVTLPGIGEPAGDAVRRVFATPHGADGESSVLGVSAEARVTDAALVNATAGHALDYDDVTGAWHPSVTLVAPAVAVGERVDASGPALLTAYGVGFETESAVAGLIQPGHYERGWHATATLGAFGATAAAASLLGLDAASARHALNVAASMPSGLKINFGTMTKPLHAGLAARSGVTAALLAAEGFTASAGALGGDGGFTDLYGVEDAPPDRLALGDEWSLVTDGVNVKKYPCCYYTHPGIAAAQRLRAVHAIDPESVERVVVRASPGAADALHYPDPQTGLEAKFSMEYTVASALARERVGLSAFEDDSVGDPLVQALRERVEFEVDADIGYDTFATTLEITTDDGETVRTERAAPPGTADDPLTDEELREKFDAAATRGPPSIDVDRAYGLLSDLRTLGDVDRLLSALRPA